MDCFRLTFKLQQKITSKTGSSFDAHHFMIFLTWLYSFVRIKQYFVIVAHTFDYKLERASNNFCHFIFNIFFFVLVGNFFIKYTWWLDLRITGIDRFCRNFMNFFFIYFVWIFAIYAYSPETYFVQVVGRLFLVILISVQRWSCNYPLFKAKLNKTKQTCMVPL